MQGWVYMHVLYLLHWKIVSVLVIFDGLCGTICFGLKIFQLDCADYALLEVEL